MSSISNFTVTGVAPLVGLPSDTVTYARPRSSTMPTYLRPASGTNAGLSSSGIQHLSTASGAFAGMSTPFTFPPASCDAASFHSSATSWKPVSGVQYPVTVR